MRELAEADVEDALGVREEALPALDVAGREARDLGAHLCSVAAVVERGAVVEADPVEGIGRHERDVIAHALAGERPELFEEKGSGHDGRTGVEREAVLAEDARASSRLLEAIDDRHRVPAHEEAHRGR